VEERYGLTEVVKVELLVDALVNRRLLWLNLGVGHLHKGQRRVLIENDGYSSLSDALIYHSGLTPASIDLNPHSRAGPYPIEAVPASNHSEEAEDDLLVPVREARPSLSFQNLQSLIDHYHNLLLPELLLPLQSVSLLVITSTRSWIPLRSLVALREASSTALLRGSILYLLRALLALTPSQHLS
jgi:hypothetical protein